MFAELYESSNPAPLGNFTFDGLSIPQGVISVPVAIPAVSRSLTDTNTLFVAWARGSLLAEDPSGDPVASSPLDFGAEDVVVVQVDRSAGGGPITVVESMVSTDSIDHQETVAVEVTPAADGYHVVFRNPAARRVVFASEQETRSLGSQGNAFACPGFWRAHSIPEDDLNLVYETARPADVPTLWRDEDCTGIPPNPLLPRPFKLVEFPEEEIGGTTVPGELPSLLRDVAVGLVLEDGRGPLRVQKNVCLPLNQSNLEPDFTLCDPDVAGPEDFAPPAVVQLSGPISASPTIVAAPQTTAYGTLAAAEAGCPAGEQIEIQLLGPYLCHVCPTPSVYDPRLQACVRCDGDLEYGPGLPVNYIPRQVSIFNLVQCLSCEALTEEQRGDGWTPAVLQPDAERCTRCTPGSQMTPCLSDDDCLIYEDARCAAEGWGRTGAPSGRVCVTRCTTDANCHGGTCDAGVCRDPFTGRESPAGRPLLCRPIGCDECWQNNYCTSDDDCPAAHKCYTGEGGFGALSPVCPLRPILSPRFEALLASLVPVFLSQEEYDEIREVLAEQRENIRQTLALVKIPDEITAPIPVFSDTVVHFNTRIKDIVLSPAAGVGDPFRQGSVELKITFYPADFQTDDPVFASTAGDWSVSFIYTVFVGPRQADAAAYSGLFFSLADVRVDGEIEIPGPNASLAPLATELETRLGPFAAQMVQTVLDALGALDRDGNGRLTRPGFLRCVFAGSPSALPQECPETGMPDVLLGAIDDGVVTVVTEQCR